jgi:hypothetical protein
MTTSIQPVSWAHISFAAGKRIKFLSSKNEESYKASTEVRTKRHRTSRTFKTSANVAISRQRLQDPDERAFTNYANAAESNSPIKWNLSYREDMGVEFEFSLGF